MEKRIEQIKEITNLLTIPHHDNLANIHAAWEEKGRIYVQMKVGGKGCLARVLSECRKTKVRLTEQKVWKYFIDVGLVSFNFN